MPHFVNTAEHYYLSTSYKVMFSSLMRQDALAPTPFGSLVRNDLKSRVGLHTPTNYLLVRHPYERAASFFRDKLRKHPQHAVEDADIAWQPSQRIFFGHIGMGASNTFEEVRERLLSLTFEDFAELVPLVFRDDPHLFPQHWTALARVGRLRYRLRKDDVLKIDDPEQLCRLRDLLGVDTSVRINSTADVIEPVEMSSRSRKIISETYAEDFATYQYAR